MTIIVRMLLGLFFLRVGYQKISSKKNEKIRFFEEIGLKPGVFFTYLIGTIEIVGGLFLLIGVFVQFSAVILGIVMIGAVIIKHRRPFLLKSNIIYYICIALSCWVLAF